MQLLTALVASFVLTMVLTVVQQPGPTPTPFPIGTLQPFGAPSTSPLPEIGRVRATRPSCAVMHDLIIPSFAAAQRADTRFAQTKVRLPQYTQLVDDPEHRTDIFRESALSKLDSDADALLADALVINKALGDPRLSADQKDPEVVAERKALQELYDAEKGRANLLTEFVMRQRNAIATNGIDTSGQAFAGRSSPPTPYVRDVPQPALTAPPGMPVLMGNDLSDREQARQWGNDLSSAVAYSENQAAKVFLPIARSCR